MFSGDLANELGGRYVEFRIYSLSYLEFLDFHKLPNTDESLQKVHRIGRYDIVGKRLFERGEKCFFENMGISLRTGCC